MELNNGVVICCVLIAILLIYAFSTPCKMNCGPGDKEGISYPFPQAGHRPSTGDFLPTVGGGTSLGGYETEGASMQNSIDAMLCEECSSHCVDWAVRHGISEGLANDREKCKNYCEIECNPNVAF